MATAETQIQACEPSFPNNSVVEPLGMGKESSSGPEQRKRCPHRRQPCAGVKVRQQRCAFSLGISQPSRVRRAATHGRGSPAEGNEDPRWIRKTFMQDVEQCRATAYAG